MTFKDRGNIYGVENPEDVLDGMIKMLEGGNMQRLCKECKAPVEFHKGEVKWVNGKWEVLSVEGDTAMCETCGWVTVHEDDDRKEYDVVFVLMERRVKTVKALSPQEAEQIVREMDERALYSSSHLDTEVGMVIEVSEVD